MAYLNCSLVSLPVSLTKGFGEGGGESDIISNR